MTFRLVRTFATGASKRITFEIQKTSQKAVNKFREGTNATGLRPGVLFISNIHLNEGQQELENLLTFSRDVQFFYAASQARMSELCDRWYYVTL